MILLLPSFIIAICLFALTVIPALPALADVEWENLNLNDSQRERLNNLDQQWQSEMSQLGPRIKANEAKRDQLMRSKDPNQSEIIELTKRILDDKARLKMDATRHFLKKREILTPQQEEKMIRMMPASRSH